jgi:hypothetical protein
MRKLALAIGMCFWVCLSYAQKLKDIPGMYFSKDTLRPLTLSLKLGSDRSISGILISEAGREFIHFTRHDNILTGVFIPSNPSKSIQAKIFSDSLDVNLTDERQAQRFILTKLEEIDLSKGSFLDPVLFGKWIYNDLKTGKLLENKYMIYYPDGSIDGAHPKHPGRLSDQETFRSGRIKMKWTTQDQHVYIVIETTLPLPIPIPSSKGDKYHVKGDTLYMTNRFGKVHKAVKDKSFVP